MNEQVSGAAINGRRDRGITNCTLAFSSAPLSARTAAAIASEFDATRSYSCVDYHPAFTSASKAPLISKRISRLGLVPRQRAFRSPYIASRGRLSS